MEKTDSLYTLLQKKNHIDSIQAYYTYTEREKYLNHAFQFVSFALKHNYKVICIEDDSLYQELLSRLSLVYSDDLLKYITFYDSSEFYLASNVFKGEDQSSKLLNVMKPIINNGDRLMMWGHIKFANEKVILQQLKKFKVYCDPYITDHNISTVCAMNGFNTPAYIQTELLKTHKYFMTDDEITKSGIFKMGYYHVEEELEKKRIHMIEQQNRQLSIDNEKLSNAYELLSRQKKEYRKLLTELPIATFITKSDCIVYANEKALIDLELPNFEFIHDVNVFEIIQFIDHSIKEQWILSLQSTQDFQLKEVELVLSNGQVKTFELKSMRTWYQGGEAILHVLIDLTPYKVLEKEMIRSEKLNIAGQLAAGIAHEIKNPLTAIKGFYKLFKLNMGKEFYYKIIDDELNRIEQIANEFLALSKPHSNVFEVHSISKIIQEVKTLLETEAILKGNEIITSFQKSDELFIYCEETKMKQVFVNLIKNAIEATTNGHIFITTKLRGENVEISIQDQGCGISESILKKVGEPFFTTKETGTGLGLLICDKIIDTHNGSRSIESTKNVGTTYTIVLPHAQNHLSLDADSPSFSEQYI
ncbi:ATP-binding protein [Alkalihalophilus marmarensis]|uniref:ATP-binding protein n=1 Tax=Alkalihalophilus marmarensis TaxID=521377 RepID=UPI002DBA873A|nr:ATP-binding protein [Alkalihalophilus marmarensis]MEC2072677.1 ATP-binding protein [Alkalihalophilus marmarensis]